MGERLGELGDDTVIVLVTFTQSELLSAYVAKHDLPFPVLVDADRVGYRSYGFGRGSVARVWGWRAARRYVDIIRRDGFGAWLRPVEDSLQLGGDIVVAADGTLAWAYYGDGPDDRPSVDELIEAVAQAD